ncbi:hypothetical protein EYZ11_012073 [Aspergillus tanneri]|uniref:Hemerythrin-like domain-containing protein n=1 Tax=Aspergillus tanneri TaxID=1220188 RepID=A0A4S3J167_9EURO|nr:hypothetical protein EYZ11_012073 [Aspergillus tanneri]
MSSSMQILSGQGQQPWANSPFTLITNTGIDARPEIPRDHQAHELARRMAHIHNLLLRALNASYNQCLSIRPDTPETRDFLLFNQCFYSMLQNHHNMEEESLFPAFGKVTGNPDVMAVNIQEHRRFETELQKFRDYIFNTDPKAYSGTQLKSHLEGLGPLLQEHLHNEIATLLDLHVVDSSTLKRVFDTAKRSSTGQSHDIFKDIPFTLTCEDNTFQLDGKATSPFLGNLARQLLKWTLGWRYPGVWRFAPSDFLGNPHPLLLPNSSNL